MRSEDAKDAESIWASTLLLLSRPPEKREKAELGNILRSPVDLSDLSRESAKESITKAAERGAQRTGSPL